MDNGNWGSNADCGCGEQDEAQDGSTLSCKCTNSSGNDMYFNEFDLSEYLTFLLIPSFQGSLERSDLLLFTSNPPTLLSFADKFHQTYSDGVVGNTAGVLYCYSTLGTVTQ
ncbi:hypothetical protein N0V82_004079 [Gnomoniopsis sp. IMI 355080]|nr:hypothetical protein N0V82_004079 [Gnomoniopsis sp. IMI 355080]